MKRLEVRLTKVATVW